MGILYSYVLQMYWSNKVLNQHWINEMVWKLDMHEYINEADWSDAWSKSTNTNNKYKVYIT